MRIIVAAAAVVLAVLAVLTGALLAAAMRSAPAGLHSVWCVQRGYPAGLAVPYVVGPGTGLSGCPAGDRQVTEP